jgi:hypothetical protein
MSRRGWLGVVVACLLVLASVAGCATRSGPAGEKPGPAGPAIVDLDDVGQLQARFNADQGAPRLVLALAPT